MAKKRKSGPGKSFHGTAQKCLKLAEKTSGLLQRASQDMEKLKGKINELESLVEAGIKRGTAKAMKEARGEMKMTAKILEDLKKVTLKYKGSQPGQLTKVKPIEEGMVKKGGVNKGPVTPRPAPPKPGKPTPPPGRLLKEPKPTPPEASTQNPSEKLELPPAMVDNNVIWCEKKQYQLNKEVAREKYYKPRSGKCKECLRCQ